jgi:GNAT superfamily N-acetyltransferase
MQLRHATVIDIPRLNELALLAKARWGYSTEQLQRWRSDLEVPPQSLAGRPVCVVEIADVIVGFTQVATDENPWDLSGMWVHPAHMGKGVGRALLAWVQRLAHAAGQTELTIDADPNAVGFYLSCGACRVGCVRAPIEGQPDRVRPQLRLPVSSAHSAQQ